MLLDFHPATLSFITLLVSICLAAIVLLIQSKMTTQATPISNQSKAVLDHYITSNDTASKAREVLQRDQAIYMEAYRARQASLNQQPIIEEVS